MRYAGSLLLIALLTALFALLGEVFGLVAMLALAFAILLVEVAAGE